MPVFTSPQHIAEVTSHSTRRAPHIVVGITHPQTCLNLGGRLGALRQAGFRVTLVSSPGELLERTAAREGVGSIALPMQRVIAPFADILSLARLWWLLRRLKPDVTEFSTPKAGLLGTVAARLAGVPVRIYMLRGLKLETCTGLKRRILLAAERMASSCAQVVLCNSESLRARAQGLGVAPRTKLNLLGEGSSNGVDTERFSPGLSDVRDKLGIPAACRVVGFVGRLTRDKGVPELLEAFDAISIADPNARLLLVGWFDGSEDALCASLRERIRRHPKIHCTGFVDDTAPYYRAMDVLVLPTWREGFPNVVLEAAASGVPVITTVATGSRDSVDPEVTGLLIQPGNPGAITEAVLSLLRNRARRQRMGKAARIWVNEHYVDGRVLQLATMFYTSLVVKEMAGRSAQALQGAGLASVLSAGDKVVGAPICDAGASSV